MDGAAGATGAAGVRSIAMRRLAWLLAVLLAGSFTTAADASTIAVDRPCYVPGDDVLMTGTGFTPRHPVVLSYGVADPSRGIGHVVYPDDNGAFTTGEFAPELERGVFEQTLPLFAFELHGLEPRNVASTLVRFSALDVDLPRRIARGQQVKLRAYGFLGGRTLYAHMNAPNHRGVHTFRVGRVRGACGIVRARGQLLPPDAPRGHYLFSFDTHRRYSPDRRPQVRKSVLLR
jgi:hypothetical protein